MCYDKINNFLVIRFNSVCFFLNRSSSDVAPCGATLVFSESFSDAFSEQAVREGRGRRRWGFWLHPVPGRGEARCPSRRLFASTMAKRKVADAKASTEGASSGMSTVVVGACVLGRRASSIPASFLQNLHAHTRPYRQL